MKRLLLFLSLVTIFVSLSAQTGKLPYKKILMTYKGDTLYAQFDGDSVRLVSNKKWAFSPELPGSVETDPVYSVSVAKTITATDTVEWNAKLSSYTETDPIYSSSVAAKITIDSTFKWASKEPYLGKPSGSGYVLSSTTDGIRSWIATTSSPISETTGGMYSNNSGWNTGRGLNSINLGYYAGSTAQYSVSIGYEAGFNTGNHTINLGRGSGINTSSATYSNFIGYEAGSNATSASNSNFIGNTAGFVAASASNSNFIGNTAGYYASAAQNSNFIGYGAGNIAKSASNSNFLGYYTGNQATSASNSNFIGYNVGNYSKYSSYSNFFGFKTGSATAGDTLGSNNIIIGTNISLPNLATNQMNLGAVLYGTGFYSTLTGNPSSIPVSGGKIGVGVVAPRTTFEVNGTISVSALSTAPASATDTGVVGEIRITSTYIYVCTATNTWVRTALTTW